MVALSDVPTVCATLRTGGHCINKVAIGAQCHTMHAVRERHVPAGTGRTARWRKRIRLISSVRRAHGG